MVITEHGGSDRQATFTPFVSKSSRSSHTSPSDGTVRFHAKDLVMANKEAGGATCHLAERGCRMKQTAKDDKIGESFDFVSHHAAQADVVVEAGCRARSTMYDSHSSRGDILCHIII